MGIPASTPVQAYSPAGTYLAVSQTGNAIQTGWGPGDRRIPVGSFWSMECGGDLLRRPRAQSARLGWHVYEGNGGNLYAYDNNGVDYQWMGGTAWNAVTDARLLQQALRQCWPNIRVSRPHRQSQPRLETADGSEVAAPGTALETASGTILYFGPQAP